MERAAATLLIFGTACGAINIGELPPSAPALVIQRIDDGAPPAEPGRRVSLGQVLRVALMIANRGGTRAEGLVPRLLVRRRDSGAPVGEVAAVPSEPPPQALGPGETAVLPFRVEVRPEASPGEWIVSASIAARQGGVPEAPEPVRRTWVVQRAAALRVLRLETVAGNTALGHTSVSPGCPASVALDIQNVGEASAMVGPANLAFDGPEPGPVANAATWDPAPGIPGGATARATFRVDAPQPLVAGVRQLGRPHLEGVDANSQAPLTVDLAGVQPVVVAMSGARLIAAEITPERQAAHPGQTDVALRVRAVYLPGPRSAAAIERPAVELQFDRGSPSWVVRPAPANPMAVMACEPPPAPCEGALFDFAVDVPADVPVGPVVIRAAVAGIDRLTTGVAVALCGRGEPAAMAVIEIGR
jgi:hypothetical protein